MASKMSLDIGTLLHRRYRIVENLGGRIELRDAPDHGALFEVLLPRSRRDLDRALEAS